MNKKLPAHLATFQRELRQIASELIKTEYFLRYRDRCGEPPVEILDWLIHRTMKLAPKASNQKQFEETARTICREQMPFFMDN